MNHFIIHRENNRSVILQFAPLKYCYKFYTVYSEVATKIESSWDKYSFVPYLDGSGIKSGDKSFVSVHQYYQLGNLKEFLPILKGIISGWEPQDREDVAVHVWCQILSGLAPPMQKIGKWTASLNNVFVNNKKQDGHLNFVIGKLEDTHSYVSALEYQRMSQIVMFAWYIYAQLAHPDVVLDINGDVVNKGPNVNQFAVQSSQFWSQMASDTSIESVMEANHDAEQLLIRFLLDKQLKETVEYSVAWFTAQHSIPFMVQKYDWNSFKDRLNEIGNPHYFEN